MNKSIKTTLGYFFSLGLGIGLGAFILGASHANSDVNREFKRRLQEVEHNHQQEIAILANENTELRGQLMMREAQVADLRFMVGHTTLQLQQSVGQEPSYDFDRFLRWNPEARKYFPYLLDAVEKYRDIWPVDPTFALAILKQESDFGRHIVSTAGALGDAQFIESTGRRYGLNSNEPWDWKNGRRNFRNASLKRRRAREARDRFLDGVARGIDEKMASHEMQAAIERNLPRYLRDLTSFYQLSAESRTLDELGWQAHKEYKSEIDTVLRDAEDLGREVRARHRREDSLIRVSGLRAPKSEEEREVEVQLLVNDFLAQADPRLSPMLLTDALVHHLADLFREFKGDRRLVASRYNASRGAMEAAVRRLGGGVGIPLLDETQDYVNKVHVLHAFMAVDAGVSPENLDISCCTTYASR